ncbi:MAG: beta-propeller fold lactonase family protein [Polyangiaceae bacterium]
MSVWSCSSDSSVGVDGGLEAGASDATVDAVADAGQAFDAVADAIDGQALYAADATDGQALYAADATDGQASDAVADAADASDSQTFDGQASDTGPDGPCSTDQAFCGGNCIDTMTNTAFCGAAGFCTGTNPVSPNYAGVACAGDAGCVNGACPRLLPAAGDLVIHPSGKLLFTHNSSSQKINVLSIAADNTLSVASTTGGPHEAPLSVADLVIDPTGQFLYAADEMSTSLYAYNIGPAGTLTSIAGSPFAIGQQCLHVRVNPAGSLLYVSCRNSFTVYAFAINPATGVLTNIAGSPFNVGVIGVGNQGIAVDPQGRFFFLVNDGSGNEGSIFGLPLPFDGGLPEASLPGSPVDSQGINPTSAIEDITGHFLYVANAVSGTVAGFSIDQTSGALVSLAGSPFNLPWTRETTILAEDLKGAVVVAGSTSGLALFLTNTDGGVLAPTASADAGVATNVSGIAIDPNTQFLYVVGSNSTISSYALNATSGAVSAAPISSVALQ